MDNRNKEFSQKHQQVITLFNEVLQFYHSQSCPCAFPRFLQIAGIDCQDTRDSYKCLETDLLISMIKEYFQVLPSSKKDEVINECWICKKCGSIYEYGWSDLSIYVERTKLKLTELKAISRGKPIIKPIPLYMGLYGHSYPSRKLISGTTFEEFRKYMLEE